MKKRMALFWATFLPVVALMILIYCFSAQTGEQSSKTSGKITTAVVRVIEKIHPSESKAEHRELEHRVSFVVRKCAHFSVFAALGFFLTLHIAALTYLFGKNSRFSLLAIPIGVLYAFSDEAHQAFVDGRGPALRDVGIDSAGVLLGVVVMTLILRKVAKRASK